MKRVGIVEFAALGLSIGLTPTSALAQSVDIPLNYAVNTGHNYGGHIANPVLILTINIGVNGGVAQPYAFDTGSSVFLTPSGVFTGSTVLATGVGNVETYGSPGGNTFSGNLYQVPASSLQFYTAPGATSGGISLSTSGNYNVASYTLLNGSVPPSQPFGTAAVGAFGASALAFTKNVSGTNVGLGGVFGQTVLPGTTAGYVVSANGQSLATLNSELGTTIPGGPVTSAQQSVQTVPQSVTNCNPCVTVGLTPALLAQFLLLNTVNATSNGMSFPNFNVLGINKFVPFNFTLGPGSTPFSLNVSLDSGWTDLALQYSGSGPVLTVAARNGGTQETFNIASSPGVPSPYNLSNSSANIVGIGFFVQNSVLYDLTGQQVGYSPNFVTDANISTTQPLVIDSSSVPLGLAGVISGPGGVSVGAGGSATLSGSNTYTGPTSISGAGAYLALVGPGTISASSEVTVSSGGVFDISNASSTAMIRSLSGDSNGVVWLGTNSLALSNAGGLFAGTIIGWGGLELISGTETLSGTNTYSGATTINGGTLQVFGLDHRHVGGHSQFGWHADRNRHRRSRDDEDHGRRYTGAG
jgi:autotransporter-associated beta strand protein